MEGRSVLRIPTSRYAVDWASCLQQLPDCFEEVVHVLIGDEAITFRLGVDERSFSVIAEEDGDLKTTSLS